MKTWQSIMDECIQTDIIELDDNPDEYALNCVKSSYKQNINISDDNLAKVLKSAYSANYKLLRDNTGTYVLVYKIDNNKLVVRLTDNNDNVLKVNGYISDTLIQNFAATFKIYLETHEIDKYIDGVATIYTKERENYDTFFRYISTFFETYLNYDY